MIFQQRQKKLLPPCGENRAGFTLIEVMVSILIIAAAFMTVLSAQQTSISEAELAIKTKLCSVLAESKMGDILTNSEIEENFSDSGEFDDFPGYVWELEPVMVEEVVVAEEEDAGSGTESEGEKPEPKKILLLKLTVRPKQISEDDDFKGLTIAATKLLPEDEWKGKGDEVVPLNNFTAAAGPKQPGQGTPPQPETQQPGGGTPSTPSEPVPQPPPPPPSPEAPK